MSAAVESAMDGRPPLFGSQRQRVVGATRVARKPACVERSWMPAGGKRAREEADEGTVKFWERTDRMWDMLQNEVQKVVAKRRAAHEANMAESRRIASLHPLNKKSDVEAGETENMSPTAEEVATPDMAPAESDIKVQGMCKSRVGALTASQTPALCPAKVGSPVMRDTAISFSRSLTFKQPSGADRNLTKAFSAEPEDITLFSLYN